MIHFTSRPNSTKAGGSESQRVAWRGSQGGSSVSRREEWNVLRQNQPALISELVVGAAFTELFGETKSPEVTLFKVLKTSWDSLDLDSFIFPVIPPSYQREKEDLLSFINSLLRHTWYLTEDLIPLVLFDDQLSLQTRTLIAQRIAQLSSGWVEIRKPTLPSISQKSELVDFVGERSTLLFDLLKTPLDFLSKPDWKSGTSNPSM
ncbi:hypothetical protein ACHWQZ_G003847 [Mnemiopsis leidyi]